MPDDQSTPNPSKPEPMTRERAIELLKTDVAAWNKWREDVDAWNALHPETIVELPDLSKAELGNAKLASADLRDVWLHEAHLEKADLSYARLEGARLTLAHLEEANLAEARLERAWLPDAHLEGAYLFQAHLERANLWGAHLERADLLDAHLNRACLRDADFSNANVTGVTYDRNRGEFQGTRVATCHGNALFRRDAQDQDYIETRVEALLRDRGSWWSRKHSLRQELVAERLTPSPWYSWPRMKGWIALYRDWFRLAGQIIWMRLWSWIDYGRNLGRVAAAAFAFAMIFGMVFDFCEGMLSFDPPEIAESWLTPYYYSIVTYTTLGFGDVTPLTATGQAIVIVEVIFGYVTLGLLVSILANKVARRA